MSRDCQAIIDLAALKHNLRVIRQRAAGSRVVAVIKADAYGHGMFAVANALQEADMLAVATLEEALQLREASILAEILALEGFHSVPELEHCITQKIIPVVHSPHQLAILNAAAVLPAQVWLKVETGMHRLGLAPEIARSAFNQLQAQGIKLVWMSHMANADVRDDPLNRQQLTRFGKIVSGLSAPHSLANSAAAWSLPETRRDWIRPGILLYGVSPFADVTGAELGLKPVMTLKSDLISIKACRAGDQVGYGSRFQCAKDTHIGVLAVGYGDGYPRQVADGTPVWLNGRQVTVAGIPSMDMLTIDLGANLQDTIGDSAELWGWHVPIETVAAMAGTIAYELTCKILPRVERIVTHQACQE